MATFVLAAGLVMFPKARSSSNCTSLHDWNCSNSILEDARKARRWRIFGEAVEEKTSSLKIRAAPSGGGEAIVTIEEGINVERRTVVVSRRWTMLLPLVMPSMGTILAFPSIAEEAIGSEVGRVELRTLNGCALGVAGFPDFLYNAEGGGGSGRTRQLTDGRIYVRFDTERLYVPAVSFGTTSMMGLPLPPGLKIEVVPKILEGYVEQDTGKVELNFLANFYFSVGPLYRAPPLVVDTTLTTESARGVFRMGQGQRLDSSGNVKLVGVARLTPVKDLLLSTFLTLPTDCLAKLSANLSFS